MMAGSCIMAFSSSWSGQISGRLVAGVGSVLMGVLMTKMVADWFAGKELSTAMAIFVNSWPIGIAISLLVLPPIGVAHGASAANLAVAALVAVGAGLLALSYHSPAVSTGPARSGGRLGLHAAMAVVCAGSIWALYNIGFVMIFSFGPSMLVERGWSITAAGSAISVVLWLSAVSVPRRFAGRSDRPARSYNGGMLLYNCSAVDSCDTNRRDHHNRYSAWAVERPGGRSDPELGLLACWSLTRERLAWACSFPFPI